MGPTVTNTDSRARALRAWQAAAAALGALPLPVLVLDTQGTIVVATRDLGESWPTSALDAMPLVDLVIAEQRIVLRDAIEGVVEHAVATALEVAMPPPGATEVTPEFGTHARLSLSALRDADAIAAVLVIVDDLTEVRRDQARLRRRERLFVDTQGVAHLGVWEWDPKQPSATWSDELFRIYGLDPSAHVPSYEDYLTRVHVEDRERVIEATNGVFQRHIPYSHDERILRTDGEWRYLHTWAEPVLDSSGALLRLIGVCQDITERRLAEIERDQLRDQRLDEARRGLQIRDEFIAVVAHELRTPLTPLKGHIQLLARAFDRAGGDAQLRRSIESALRQVARLAALVEVLLDVSTMRWGQLSLRRESCDLSAIVRDTLAELDGDIRSAHCDVELTLGEHVTGDWDRVRLGQVVTNLLSNAIKFGAEASIGVRVAADDRFARLVVVNQGPPIPASAHDRIFDPFERAAPVGNYPGLGLGLYVAREIVRAHGGTISVQSGAARETSFSVELPLHAPSPAGHA